MIIKNKKQHSKIIMNSYQAFLTNDIKKNLNFIDNYLINNLKENTKTTVVEVHFNQIELNIEDPDLDREIITQKGELVLEIVILITLETTIEVIEATNIAAMIIITEKRSFCHQNAGSIKKIELTLQLNNIIIQTIKTIALTILMKGLAVISHQLSSQNKCKLKVQVDN